LKPGKKSLRKLVGIIDDESIVVDDGVNGAATISLVIDEISSRACCLVYLSHNFEPDYYSGLFVGYVGRIEERIVSVADIVVAASVRDALRYRDEYKAGEKIVVFPNVFPEEFRPMDRLEWPSVAIVAGSNPAMASKMALFLAKTSTVKNIVYVGKAERDLLNSYGQSIRDKIIHYEHIPSRGDYLAALSAVHIGVNYGVWLGGSNVKRFDYALAGLLIASNGTGSRGEYLPGEICFADPYDLVAKIKMLNRDEAEALGTENQRYALRLHDEAVSNLRKALMSLVG
jgi:hypothetical protein